MSILKGYQDVQEILSTTEYRVFAASVWIIVLLFTGLLILICINTWMILYKLEKWKTVPLLFFYMWSFLAVTFRLIRTILGLESSFWSIFGSFDQPVFKLCAGMMQAWIIFELTIRIRSTRLSTGMSAEKVDNLIKYGQITVAVFTSLIVISSFTIFVFVYEEEI